MASTSSSSFTELLRPSEFSSLPLAATNPSAVAKIVVEGDYDIMTRNCVMLSTSVYDTLFPDPRASEAQFVQTGHFIYQAIKDKSLQGNIIVMNSIHYMDCSDMVKGGEIFVRAAGTPSSCKPSLTSMTLDISLFEPHFRKEGSNGPVVINVEDLRRILLREYSGQYLKSNQTFFLHHHEAGALAFKVTHADMVRDPYEPLLTCSLGACGLVSSETLINFSVFDSDTIVLVEECPRNTISSFNFIIETVRSVTKRVMSEITLSAEDTSTWRWGVTPLPLTVPFKAIADAIKEKLCNVPLIPGHVFPLTVGGNGDWEYDILLNVVLLNPHSAVETGQKKYAKRFKLESEHLIKVISNKNIIFTRSNALPAEKMTIEIIGFEADNAVGRNGKKVVSARDIEEQLRIAGTSVTSKSKLTIEVPGGLKLLLEVVKAVGTKPDDYIEQPYLEDLWSIDDTTKFVFNVRALKEIKIVDTYDVYNIHKLKVKISQESSGPINKEGRKIVRQDHLKETFIEATQRSNLSKNQQIRGRLDNGQEISFIIQEMNFGPGGKPKCKYGAIYECDENTEIQFDAEQEGQLVIAPKPLVIDYTNVGEKLSELGIGGLKEKFEVILRQFILPREKYKDWNTLNGQKPPRGLLLSGPPGTGKTLLARQLGSIFGCTKERITFVPTSSIWNKYVGESEKNIRKLFAAARAAQLEFGDASPTFLIILDECEGLLGKRKESDQRYLGSVTGAFLEELDGNDQLNNVIVIGITNRPEMLDDAVVRPGRLSPTIEVSLPDALGRKEIFEIHTRKMRDNDALADDINYDVLAEMTVGRSGAFIEGFVNRAFSFTFTRLSHENVPATEVANHPSAKVTMQDFITAFEELVCPAKAHIKAVVPSTAGLLNIRDYLATNKEIVGVSKDVIDTMEDVIRTRVIHKELVKESGIILPRGLLIHGPAGAGKTVLAKSFENLLHCRPDQFHYFSGNQLLWGSGREAKEQIRAIFAPAYQAAKDLKSDAPLYVVVIEDIDMLFPNDAMPHDPSKLIDLFLSDVDSLFDQEDKPTNSLLVIGTLKHKGHIGENDPLRKKTSSMLCLGNPTTARRREALSLFLKKEGLNFSPPKKEEKVQSEKKEKEKEKVDTEAIVTLTSDMSFGKIKQLISRTMVIALRSNAELATEHFEEAFRDMKNEVESSFYS